jgi:serine/threonine-protein kinase
VLALLLGGILFWASNQGSKQATVTVPNVVGKTQAVASQMLAGQHLIPAVKPVNSAKTPGIVVRQDPTPDSNVKKDSTVTISVSVGVGTEPIPDVSGETTNDAKSKLTDAGFQVKVDPAESSSTIAPDSVIRTIPAVGAEAEKGSVVHIVPSKGVAIPNVANLSQQQAIAALVDAGLQPQTQTESSDTVPIGNVTRTDPPYGTTGVAGGSPITVFVSTGSSQVSVPPVIGFSVSMAKSTLEGANLQSTLKFEPTTVQANDGKVLNQDPPPGTRVDPQSNVVLTVGEYTPPVTTPTSKGPTTTAP